MAADRRVPESLPEAEVIYDTQTVVGQCAPGAEAAPIVAALAGTAISQGISRIGAALTAAAEAKTDVVIAKRNMELITSKGVGPCVTIARGWFYRSTPTYSGQGKVASPFADNPASAWPYRQRVEAFWQKGLYLASVPDFYFQGAVISSLDKSRYAIVPTVVTMDAPISRTVLRPSNVRDVIVAFAIGEQELDLSKGAGATMVIGQMRPGQQARIPTALCVFHNGVGERPNACPSSTVAADIVLYGSQLSEWFAVPVANARKPMYLQAMVSETRDASKFLGFVAAVFNDQSFKTALNTQVQQALISPVGHAADDKAEIDKLKLENEHDSAIVAARGALQACVRDPSADGRLNARIAMRKLMAAAIAAGKPQLLGPTQVDAIAESGTGAAPCQSALTLLG
ncbi:hypothetical protein [Variovorax sp. LT1R16]|uniref:hypothetical protein n=1 Tax=Variovorax sp. LT1R16 TaxID=3443728 RepID=UPI003F45307E